MPAPTQSSVLDARIRKEILAVLKSPGRTLAIFGVALLGLTGVVSAVSADSGNIDPARDGHSSLTIHKYAGMPEGAAHDGQQLPVAPDLEPLKGVRFSLYQLGVQSGGSCVPVDLETAAGWDTVDALNAGTLDRDSFCEARWFSDVTNDQGTIVFNDLDLGFYYVEETHPGDNKIVEAVEPFFVTVPTPTVGAGDGADYFWNYDVVVYPKNQISDAPTKVITDQPDGLIVGSNVTWVISAPIPDTVNPLTRVSIYDALLSALTYTDSSVVVMPKGSTDPVDAIPLKKGEHYTMSGEAERWANDLYWNFTPEGLDVVNANREGTIVIDLVTAVNSTYNGTIPNAPGPEHVGYGAIFNDATTPGDRTPYTYWANLVVGKVDESDPANYLSGAEFALTELVDDVCPAFDADDAIATGTTNADGWVLWDAPVNTTVLGVWVQNSNVALDAPVKEYCLYETKAPAGYVAKSGGTVVEARPLSGSPVMVEVPNAIRQGPELPVTGATGVVILAVVGVLLVGVGAFLVIRGRRQ